MGYPLPMTDLDCELAIAPVGALKLHEEVVDSHVDTLRGAIEREGLLRDPVIVDRDADVVLDGMHRVTAITQLGLDGIPVCRVDYADPSIELGGWFRMYDPLPIDRLRDRCAAADLHLEAVKSPDPQDRTWPARPLVVSSAGVFDLTHPDATIADVLDRTRDLIADLEGSNDEPDLIPDTDDPAPAGDQAALLIPPPDKAGVLAAAESGDRFPPTTSRHVIPTRPMGVDAPLELLTGDLKRSTRRLSKRLAERSIERQPAGGDYAGRPYEEELLVFQ